MPTNTTDTITVAFEIKLVARKRIEGLDGSIPVHFNAKETATINKMIAKNAEPLQAEIESYIRLTRGNDGTLNNRVNKQGTGKADT